MPKYESEYLERRDWFMRRYPLPRDYSWGVYERYMRRFGYLSEVRAVQFNDKIKERWQYGWKSQSHADGLSWELLRYGRGAEGSFCPIGLVGGVYRSTQEETLKIAKCPRCGSLYRIKKSVVLEGRRSLQDIWPPYVLGDMEGIECSDDACRGQQEMERKALEFMEGRHSIIDKAKEHNIPLNRPRKRFMEAEPEEKIVLAMAALLDFEARFLQRTGEL